MSHLPAREISQLLHEKWKHGTSLEEREKFDQQAILEEQKYYDVIQANKE